MLENSQSYIAMPEARMTKLDSLSLIKIGLGKRSESASWAKYSERVQDLSIGP